VFIRVIVRGRINCSYNARSVKGCEGFTRYNKRGESNTRLHNMAYRKIRLALFKYCPYLRKSYERDKDTRYAKVFNAR